MFTVRTLSRMGPTTRPVPKRSNLVWSTSRSSDGCRNHSRSQRRGTSPQKSSGVGSFREKSLYTPSSVTFRGPEVLRPSTTTPRSVPSRPPPPRVPSVSVTHLKTIVPLLNFIHHAPETQSSGSFDSVPPDSVYLSLTDGSSTKSAVVSSRQTCYRTIISKSSTSVHNGNSQIFVRDP